MKVLIAEDDDLTRQGLVETLELEGYRPIPAKDGKIALELFEKENPDFVCLDIMMPGLDGYEVCKQIRQKKPNIPIMFISAKSEEIDKILGLELGADDYIIKPFGVREVLARIRAITRRCMASSNNKQDIKPFEFGDLIVYPSELKTTRGKQTIELSFRDIKLLELFYNNPGKILNRDMIFNHVWGMNYFPNSRTLDQHISQLRKRIEIDPKDAKLIKTVHGVGYKYK